MSFDLSYMRFVYIFFFRALRFQLERKDREMKILVSRNSFFFRQFSCFAFKLLFLYLTICKMVPLRRVISLKSVFPLKSFTLYVSVMNANA